MGKIQLLKHPSWLIGCRMQEKVVSFRFYLSASVRRKLNLFREGQERSGKGQEIPFSKMLTNPVEKSNSITANLYRFIVS